MKPVKEEKTSLVQFLLFLISGIIITGLCLDKLIIFYYTNKIVFRLNGMIIEGAEAFFSTFTFFVAGLLFIIYGALEYHKLLKSRGTLRVIATCLLFIIIGMTIYYSTQYIMMIRSEYYW